MQKVALNKNTSKLYLSKCVWLGTRRGDVTDPSSSLMTQTADPPHPTSINKHATEKLKETFGDSESGDETNQLTKRSVCILSV